MSLLSASSTYRPRMSSGRFIDIVIKPGVVEGVTELVDAVYDRSQALVPVNTGELKASGEKQVEEVGKTIRGTVSYSAGHAGYVEFGTGSAGASSTGAGPYSYDPNWPGMAAQPFLRPAYDEAKAQATDMIGSKVGLAIE